MVDGKLDIAATVPADAGAWTVSQRAPVVPTLIPSRGPEDVAATEATSWAGLRAGTQGPLDPSRRPKLASLQARCAYPVNNKLIERFKSAVGRRARSKHRPRWTEGRPNNNGRPCRRVSSVPKGLPFSGFHRIARLRRGAEKSFLRPRGS
jgi:hypothetical protein